MNYNLSKYKLVFLLNGVPCGRGTLYNSKTLAETEAKRLNEFIKYTSVQKRNRFVVISKLKKLK